MPRITCPKCSHQIPLTKSLAAPLLEAERSDFQKKLAARETEFAREAGELRQQREELAKTRASIEEQIKQRLESERTEVAAAEAKKAREQVAGDLRAMQQRLDESEELLEARNVKLAEAAASSS